MLSLITFSIPIALVFYSFWRARRQSIFLISIVFFQVLGTGILFNQLWLFWIPGRLGNPVIVSSWLLLLFFAHTVLTRVNQAQAAKIPGFFSFVLPYESIILALLALWFASLFASLIDSQDPLAVLQTGINYFTMFIGYFGIKTIFLRSPQKSLADFLGFIASVNILTLLIFTLDTIFQLNILPKRYLELQYLGSLVQRSFLPSSFFWLGLAYWLSKPRWNIKIIAGLGLAGIAGILSGTRSLFFLTIFLIALSFLLQFIKRANSKALWLRIAIGIMVLLVLGFIGITFFPGNVNYVVGRSIGLTSQDNTLNVRYFYFQQVASSAMDINPVLGGGFRGEPVVYTWYNTVYQYAFADGEWMAVVWRYGFLGLGLFALLHTWSIYETFRQFLRAKDEKQSSFWQMMFLWVLPTPLFSFFTWTILNEHQFFVLALLPYALISTGLYNQKKAALQTKP